MNESVDDSANDPSNDPANDPANAPMESPVDPLTEARLTEARLTEARLTELEIKASFTEDLVDRLNEVIVTQQRQIERLMIGVNRLRQEADTAESGTFRSLREELPPHY